MGRVTEETVQPGRWIYIFQKSQLRVGHILELIHLTDPKPTWTGTSAQFQLFSLGGAWTGKGEKNTT